MQGIKIFMKCDKRSIFDCEHSALLMCYCKTFQHYEQAWGKRKKETKTGKMGRSLPGNYVIWRETTEIHVCKGNHPTLEGNLRCWREIITQLAGKCMFFQVCIWNYFRLVLHIMNKYSGGKTNKQTKLTTNEGSFSYLKSLHIFLPFQAYSPTMFESYTSTLEVEKYRIDITVWDTSGKFPQSKRLCICLLVCLSVCQGHFGLDWLAI